MPWDALKLSTTAAERDVSLVTMWSLPIMVRQLTTLCFRGGQTNLVANCIRPAGILASSFPREDVTINEHINSRILSEDNTVRTHYE